MSAEIKVKPVNKANWGDLEKLFESRGGPSYCWCMPWRSTSEERKHSNRPNRKEFLKERVFRGTPVGLLAYLKDEPVAWCSVAPRDTYMRLGGDDSVSNVWSIVCFFIKRQYRNTGLSKILIDKSKEYARKLGAEYLEAYPVAMDSPSYRFMGFVSTFENKGFRFVKKAGSRRNVMIYKI